MRIVGQPGPYRHFDANATLAGALATIQPSIDRTDAWVTHDPLPVVYGDPNRICYIFASLIENSLKFRSECRPDIHVAAVEAENGWLFSVCDNAIGIDPRHRDRIFGLFKRIHNEAYPGAAWDWRSPSESSNGTAAGSGWNRASDRAPPSSLFQL
jgi:chemotaxis family two-component system sensor kinase Cph1